MTRADPKPHVDARRIAWDHVVDTLVNAHAPPRDIASFMSGAPILGLSAGWTTQQLISSGVVPLQPLAV